MKTLEQRQDKLAHICQLLRQETLAPAEREAAGLVDKAHIQAEEIVRAAERTAEAIEEKTRQEMEKERKVFESTLKQAASQSLETLRQQITQELFVPQLEALLVQSMADPQLIASILSALVQAIEKQGVEADLMAVLPKQVSPDEINRLLLVSIRERLAKKEWLLEGFQGGAKLKLLDKKITLDMSDAALLELFMQFIRKDLRKFLFG